MKENAPIPHSHEHFVDLVNRLPKVTEWTPEEKRAKGHLQFGNNFKDLFLGRLRAERASDPQAYRNGAVDMSPSFELRKVETKYPEQWLHFLTKNDDLIKQMNDPLDESCTYQKILKHFSCLLIECREKGDYTEADLFMNSGIEEVGIYIWRQLNPLLEEAAKKMDEEGINPKEFFG